jgi:phenylacetate-CoA ligase
MLAPAARIVRKTGSQRSLLGRRDATVAAWRELAATADEAQARAAVAARLPLLAARMWRSPYWCDVLRRAALSPRDLDSLEALAAFPALERGTLGEADAGDALAALAPGDEAVFVRSSGTTGDPVRVLKDRWDSLVMWAALGYWLEVAGVAARLPARPRVVLLDALPGGLEYSVRLRLVGDGGGALHRISLARGEARAVDRLRRVGPAVVFSDPEGLHAYARAAASVPAPILLLTSAQRFAPEARARCAIPTINYYATTETGPIAWECLHAPDRFHVLAPEVWVESVGGELLVTRLRDSVLPLCRYRTGDAGSVEREPAATGCGGCGFHGWSIVGFRGRSACTFVTPAPARREVDAWSLAWLFKHHALRSFRLTQTAPEAFTLRFDGAPAAAPPLAAALADALVQLGWNRATLRLDVRAAPDATSASAALKPAPFARDF